MAIRPSALRNQPARPRSALEVISEGRWANPTVVFRVEIRIAGADRVFAKAFLGEVGFGGHGLVQFRYGRTLDFRQPVLQALCRIGFAGARSVFGRLANPAAHIGAGCFSSAGVSFSNTCRAARAYRALRECRNNVGRRGFAPQCFVAPLATAPTLGQSRACSSLLSWASLMPA